MDWRSGKIHRPCDPPFHPPSVHEDGFEDGDDEESAYSHIPPVSHRASTYDDSNAQQSSPFSDANRFRDSGPSVPSSAAMPGGYGGGGIPAGRPSMDAYGAFDDPPPSGFGAAPPAPESPSGPPVSRTMQYADPYAAVRAQIAPPPGSPPGAAVPPSYESYQGYR